MIIRKGEYVIAKIEKKDRLFLAKTASKQGWPIRAISAEDDVTDAAIFELSQQELVANLGRNPREGPLGLRVTPFREKLISKIFGTIKIFRLLSSMEKKVLLRSLLRCGRKLEEKDLDSALPTERFQVLPPRGKYAGTYKFSKKGDTISLFPQEWLHLDYVTFHEVGHNLWFRLFGDLDQVRWIKLYHNCVSLTKIKDQEINALKAKLVDSEWESLADFLEELDEKEELIWEEILEWIGSNHHLAKKHLECLVYRHDREALLDLFPTARLFHSQVEPLVSEYGSKNPEEFWAESFSYYMTGKSLPIQVKKLVIRTIKKISGKKEEIQ